MHVTHDRLGGHNLLAIEFGNDTKRAVSRGVLRTDVEGHPLGFDLDVHSGISGLLVDVSKLL